MANDSEQSDFDKILKDGLSPTNFWGTSSFGNFPLSDKLDAICVRVDELTKGQGADDALKNIYKDLTELSSQVRALEQTHDAARSEHDLQMDLERENQRRLQR